MTIVAVLLGNFAITVFWKDVQTKLQAQDLEPPLINYYRIGMGFLGLTCLLMTITQLYFAIKYWSLSKNIEQILLSKMDQERTNTHAQVIYYSILVMSVFCNGGLVWLEWEQKEEEYWWYPLFGFGYDLPVLCTFGLLINSLNRMKRSETLGNYRVSQVKVA